MLHSRAFTYTHDGRLASHGANSMWYSLGKGLLDLGACSWLVACHAELLSLQPPPGPCRQMGGCAQTAETLSY